MLALAAVIPPPKEWIIGCLKVPSGDVWLSDRPVNASLLALLPAGADPLPIVEDWGTLDDGGGLDKLLSVGLTGYLCCPRTRIVLIRADQTKAAVDAVIEQGIHNRQVDLYRWFEGMTSAPVLIDTLFCQDRIELAKTSMLFSFDAVGALAAENPYMTDRANGNKNWPYLIGKAQGVPLELLEDRSSKWTTLLGDQDGNEINEDYTGLIRVQDATQLNAGQHLINGEEVILAKASAGYMELTTRARGGTEAQEHGNGSRIFPLGAVFKYAVCAGPIGSFDLLRTSNEADFYDEDGDGNTTEYRDLYSGGNEELHSELNPAQIWFNDRMPWLKKGQDYDVDDKIFYGTFTSFSSVTECSRPSQINEEDGSARLFIPFRKFSKNTGDPDDYWFNGTTIPLPALPGESGGGRGSAGTSTYAASENMNDGSDYFSVSQSFGDYLSGTGLTSTAWREFRINSNCPPGEEGWTMIAPVLPPEGFVYTEDKHKWAMVIQRFTGKDMTVKFELLEVHEPIGGVDVEFIRYSVTKLAGLPGVEQDWYVDLGQSGNFIADYSDFVKNKIRIKMKLTCVSNDGPGSYAYIRVGSSIANGDGTFHYGLGALWNYLDAAPSSYITSTFGKNLSYRGVFRSAKVRVKGTLRNSENKADGTVKIYENDAEKYSVSITDGDQIDQEITLSATSWAELRATEVKVEVSLDYALIYDYSALTITPVKRTDGFAGIDFDGGIQWLVSYTSSNLDGIQVNYTDQLYVDAVSTRGADWTPAQAFQWITEDKASWATSLLDTTDLSARHTEYDTAGYYLNGLITSERYQDAIKEVTRQGFSLPVQVGGKVSLQSYLSWPSVISVSGDLDSILDSGQTFSQSDTNALIQRLVVDYKKNFSTGILDGQEKLSTGEHVENMTQFALDLVGSDPSVVAAAAWLFSLKSVQLKSFGFDGNFRLLPVQRWDRVKLTNFLASDLQEDMFIVSVSQQIAQPKNDRPTKFIINTIKV